MTSDQLTQTDSDERRADAFAKRIVGVLNDAGIALSISIGHQTGLLDVLAGLAPSTTEQIAQAAHLNQRYVREWLGSMVTGGIVEHDPSAGTFSLPAEHASCLTRTAGPDNLATQFPYIALLGEVEQQIVHCFRHGGGVPYASFPRFHDLMAAESAQVFDASLVDKTLPLVPGLVDRLHAGIDVADIGCGSGHAVNLMARAFPASRFTGYDISADALGTARAEAERMGVSNARFVVCDAAALDEPSAYGLITAFDAIHDQAQPTKVLAAIARSLCPNGVFLMVDVAASSNLADNMDHPLAPFLYTISTMHCTTVSLAEDGEGLGAMWGEQQALGKLAEAGFAQIEVKQILGDVINNCYVASLAHQGRAGV